MKKIKIFAAAVLVSASAFLIYQSTLEASGTGKSSKICSAFVAGNWRNDIAVMPQWTGSDCWAWAKSIGADQYQLACLTDDEVVYGSGGGMPPAPNCGW